MIGPVEPSADLIVARRISRINQQIVLAGLPWAVYPILDTILGGRHFSRGHAPYVLLTCALINPVLMYVASRINRYSKGIFDDPWPGAEQIAKYRKLGKWQITLGILVNIVGFTPIFYAWGYIPRWAQLIPGAQVLGKKISYGFLFLIAAIVAGLLGNFVYDVLKYFFTKLVMKDG